MRIAVIDDLQNDRTMICSYINTYFTQVSYTIPLYISQFVCGEDFLSEFALDSFDIIFIDFFMNTLSGLDTARTIRCIDAHVIIFFMTASRDYAIDAYKVKASGYLLKPFCYGDFVEALSVIDANRIRQQAFLEIHSQSNHIRILVNNIIYCDIAGHYAQIHTLDVGICRIRTTFSKIEQMLSHYPELLCCYRGCIVNMNYIISIDNLTFIMLGEERIPFRKKDQSKIVREYSDFLFEKNRSSLQGGI